jgi:hypothetical protein
LLLVGRFKGGFLKSYAFAVYRLGIAQRLIRVSSSFIHGYFLFLSGFGQGFLMWSSGIAQGFSGFPQALLRRATGFGAVFNHFLRDFFLLLRVLSVKIGY